jgi:manganese/iron transport system ATP-binding protein
VSELVRLDRAVLGYRTPVLGPLDAKVLAGERWAVLGPNGGGKTTFLKALSGLIPLLAGSRTVAGGPRARLGYVPQAHRTDPVYPLSVLEVTLQGRLGVLGLWKRPGARDRDLARELLKKVGLEGRESFPFRALSGGQRQRVLLARALCGEPNLLFLDEFTSELDPAGTAALLGEVTRLTREASVSVVFITHEVSSAAAHATHVALVDGRRSLFETGPVDALLTGDQLTRLYGQRMQVERRNGRTIVHVESAVEGS